MTKEKDYASRAVLASRVLVGAHGHNVFCSWFTLAWLQISRVSNCNTQSFFFYLQKRKWS